MYIFSFWEIDLKRNKKVELGNTGYEKNSKQDSGPVAHN